MQITWLESERLWIKEPKFNGWDELMTPGYFAKFFRVEIKENGAEPEIAVGYYEGEGLTDLRTMKPEERWNWDMPTRILHAPRRIHELFNCLYKDGIFSIARGMGKMGMFGRYFSSVEIDGIRYRGHTMDTKYPHFTCWLWEFDTLVETLKFEKIRDEEKTESEYCYFCNCFHYVQRTYVGNIQSSRRQYIYTAYNVYPDRTERIITDIKKLWSKSAQHAELPPKLRVLQRTIKFPRPFLLLNELIWLHIQNTCDAYNWSLTQFNDKYQGGELTIPCR